MIVVTNRRKKLQRRGYVELFGKKKGNGNKKDNKNGPKAPPSLEYCNTRPLARLQKFTQRWRGHAAENIIGLWAAKPGS